LTLGLVQVGRGQLLPLYGPDEGFSARDSIVAILFTLLVIKVIGTGLAPVDSHVINFRPRHRVLLFREDLRQFARLHTHFLSEHADVVELFLSALAKLRFAPAMQGNDIVTVFQVEGSLHQLRVVSLAQVAN